KEKNTFEATAKRLRDSFYVDNCVTSFDTPEEVKSFEKEAKVLMMKGKFELRAWMTNSTQEEDPVSVLGVQWNRYADDLCCNVNIKSVPERITKRDLLSITQQIFDPIGFLSPVTLVPKLITQKAWMIKTGWDEEIPTELKREYKDWISSIDCINKCKIPRRLSERPLSVCKVTIHVFSDASKDAYAGCIFLRTEHEGNTTIRLVMAKSRVAPIKRQMTLPRLELMGALIASRLYKELMNSGALSTINNYRTYCWTDSSVVLAWLKREEAWGAFVINRVKEICTNTRRESWNHLPGIYNPADLPSRGCKPKTLLENNWWTGPEWLYLEEENWPKSEINTIKSEEDMIASELRRSVAVNMETNAVNFSDKLLYFSKYKKIVRLVARLLRMRPKIRKKYKVDSIHIRNEEYQNAEETIIKIVQKETYTGKIKDKKLLTIEMDGIIRVKTRLAYSGESSNFIYPILLPGKHELIKRMIQQKHKDMQHAGTQTMLAELRNTYWIIGVRRLLKKIVAECRVCKRYKAKHYEAPLPPLPADRIGNTAPFEVTGIDLAGPYGKPTQGSKLERVRRRNKLLQYTMEVFSSSSSLVGRVVGANDK
ncbi:PREDICTED: uncharacterized protein LOC106114555, partial [Papilio xuthus]|uniref:Uncharacterized protein LOC106114555 n=1 Tax=Papilio xuthus TaxID=66420 RepID=A0AAJ6Z1Q6_PAPXU